MTVQPTPVQQRAISPYRAKPRPRTIIAIVLLALIMLAWGIYWWTTGRWLIDTDDAYVRADIVTLAPRISGYLTEVNVEDNQQVRAGEVLAQIDTRDYQAKVCQAAAAVRAAAAELSVQQARIFSLQARQIQQKSRIDDAQAAVRAAGAESERSALEERRQVRLMSQNVSSMQQLEAAKAEMNKTAANLARAQAQALMSKQALMVLASDRQAAEAELVKADALQSQAQAVLNLARINLGSTQIKSPIAGTAGERTLRVGQYVEVGSPLLAVVPDSVYVIANFKETQIDLMRIGQTAEVTVDAYDGQRFNGTVESFAPASGAQFALLPPDNATGNFTKIVQRMPVRIRLNKGQARLGEIRPGMSVIVTVDTHHG